MCPGTWCLMTNHRMSEVASMLQSLVRTTIVGCHQTSYIIVSNATSDLGKQQLLKNDTSVGKQLGISQRSPRCNMFFNLRKSVEVAMLAPPEDMLVPIWSNCVVIWSCGVISFPISTSPSDLTSLQESMAKSLGFSLILALHHPLHRETWLLMLIDSSTLQILTCKYSIQSIAYLSIPKVSVSYAYRTSG